MYDEIRYEAIKLEAEQNRNKKATYHTKESFDKIKEHKNINDKLDGVVLS